MIERLQISNLRNLTQVNLQSTACNVIIGENGSGKTSLLEAIFLLSRGKSFRHHQPKRYIQHHKKSAV
ncbi:MAG: AAA family ATPase, partial [Moraxellaceae bacterium]